MPPFSNLWKRSNRAADSNHGAAGNDDQQSTADNGTGEKVQRRQSKRDFFRNLLKPTSPWAESRSSQRHSDQMKDPIPSSSNKQIIPMPNSNKPLPAPPLPNSGELPPLADEPVRLKRIISPLSIDDVHKLFSGAPQFFVRSEGHHTGPPKPSVAFPWNTELEVRDLCDFLQNEDQAWSSVTTYPHITRDLNKGNDIVTEQKEKQRGHFMPVCHERPNMLSMQGLERGTIGFSAALEIAVADALYNGTENPESPGSGTLSERRRNFLEDLKHGVRPLSEFDITAKLIEIGESYHQVPPPERKSSVEQYTELFTKVLFPPTRVKDSDDPYSLEIQIESLLEVLGVSNIWVDFGIVEWRIRLGQILWGTLHELDNENTPINVEIHDSGVPETEKFWLLLQILLSCEVLVRLDLVAEMAEHNPDIVTPNAFRRFSDDAKPSIRWSLVLARLWLENILIQRVQYPTELEEKKSSGGWLATLTGTSVTTPKDTHSEKFATVMYYGRHQARQISGLVHFAQKLHWPQVERVATKFSENAALISESAPGTPAVGTPLSMTAHRSSYFGSSSRPVIKRALSKQHSRRSVMVQPSGWLSRSYLTGLVLPGEALSHFLISTLLENDESAVSRLGDEANLYGGFIYASKSYWSTACIIGRVLAAGKGASECMGWLSSGFLPEAVSDGWVNIEVEIPPQNETARIWKKHIIERECHVLGDGDILTILPGDFTLPVDDIVDSENLEVCLKSLRLFRTVESAENTPKDEKSTSMSEITVDTQTATIQDYSAKMAFTVKSLGKGCKDLLFRISYDVHFVTAHPCIPSQHTNLLDSPTSPLFQVPKTSPVDINTMSAGHPLHKSFIYKRECLSQVLHIYPQPSGSHSSPLASLNTTSQEIFVIDCTEPHPPLQPDIGSINLSSGPVARKRNWGSDLEMLARAWCAEYGYNALISRRGRNCVACSIREARALGWKIVLRFG